MVSEKGLRINPEVRVTQDGSPNNGVVGTAVEWSWYEPPLKYGKDGVPKPSGPKRLFVVVKLPAVSVTASGPPVKIPGKGKHGKTTTVTPVPRRYEPLSYYWADELEPVSR